MLNGHAQVKDVLGTDVSKAFIEGAYQTLKLAQQHHVDIVVLKEFSPSCGTHAIYDGSFSRTKIEGQGITATPTDCNMVFKSCQNTNFSP